VQQADDVLAFVGPLYATAVRLTRDRADAEDLVQDTLLKAFRASDRFARGTNLRAWLYTILHNTWRNGRRDRARAPVDVDSERVEASPLAAGDGESPEALLLRDTLDEDLQAALAGLPEKHRTTFMLREFEGLSYEDMAKVMDVSMGTVMSRLHHARKKLQKALLAMDVVEDRRS